MDIHTEQAYEQQPTQLWNAFLSTISSKVSSHVLETWLKPVSCAECNHGTIVLEVPDQFFKDWLADHYIDVLQDGLSVHAGRRVNIVWRVNPNLRAVRQENEPAAQIIERQPQTKNTSQQRLQKVADAPTSNTTLSRSTWNAEVTEKRELNKRYTFETFVSGPSNQFASAACKAVAQNPGFSYNPLFIFGGVGLGKTHLLSAIGHQILQERPDANVIYTSSEQFTNEVINAVLGGKLEDFRNKYRAQCDVLLIDDIQLIAGKERTQHEFFHVFNNLYDSQRQIVVTSDKLPHEIPEIEERLRNRFQWGLIADVQPPEIETRIAIIRKKAAAEMFEMDDNVIFFLAKNIRSNVRELEGALVRIMAHVSLNAKPVTMEYVKQMLGEVLQNKQSHLCIELIQRIVAQHFRIKISDLKSHKRLRDIVVPRQLAIYLCRKYTQASFPELGSRFGHKDHTTIMNACKRMTKLLKTDLPLQEALSEIEQSLSQTDSASVTN